MSGFILRLLAVVVLLVGTPPAHAQVGQPATACQPAVQNIYSINGVDTTEDDALRNHSALEQALRGHSGFRALTTRTTVKFDPSIYNETAGFDDDLIEAVQQRISQFVTDREASRLAANGAVVSLRLNQFDTYSDAAHGRITREQLQAAELQAAERNNSDSFQERNTFRMIALAQLRAALTRTQGPQSARALVTRNGLNRPGFPGGLLDLFCVTANLPVTARDIRRDRTAGVQVLTSDSTGSSYRPVLGLEGQPLTAQRHAGPDTPKTHRPDYAEIGLARLRRQVTPRIAANITTWRSSSISLVHDMYRPPNGARKSR